MLHFLLEIIIINRSNKTRSLLRDKYDRCHSDRHYRGWSTLLIKTYLTTPLQIDYHYREANVPVEMAMDHQLYVEEQARPPPPRN